MSHFSMSPLFHFSRNWCHDSLVYFSDGNSLFNAYVAFFVTVYISLASCVILFPQLRSVLTMKHPLYLLTNRFTLELFLVLSCSTSDGKLSTAVIRWGFLIYVMIWSAVAFECWRFSVSWSNFFSNEFAAWNHFRRISPSVCLPPGLHKMAYRQPWH